MSGHPSTARLQAFVLDELDGDARLAIDAHLRECVACRRRVEAERRLDEWVVRASPPVPEGQAGRDLERLWRRLDEEPAEPASAPLPRPLPFGARALRGVAVLAAAALLVLMTRALLPGAPETPSTGPGPLAGRDGARSRPTARRHDVPPARPGRQARRGIDGRAGTAHDPTEHDEVAVLLLPPEDEPDAAAAGSDRPAPPPDPTAGRRPLPLPPAFAVVPGESVDPQRLAAVREQVAARLVAAHQRFPFQRAGFLQDCEELLAGLRRQGWPLGSLVRGLARSDDPDLVPAALHYAALSPATAGVLADALGDPRWRDEALARLDAETVSVEDSPALVRALEQVATGAPGAWSGAKALDLLSTGGPRSTRALGDLADDAVARALAPVRPGGVPAAPFTVLDHCPPAIALPRLLALAASDTFAPGARERFGHLAASRPPDLTGVLLESLGDPALAPRVRAWLAADRLTATVPALLARLEEQPREQATLDTLVAVGGEEAAAGLFALWRDPGPGPSDQALRGALFTLLADDRALARRLGAATPLAWEEDLVRLAAVLPGATRGALLLGALGRRERPGVVPAGSRSALLVALGQLAGPDDGRELLAWIATRPDDDAVLPLAWATAAALAQAPALSAWDATGRDPRVLAAVATAAGERLHHAVQPSEHLLAPVARSLVRGVPPGSRTPRMLESPP